MQCVIYTLNLQYLLPWEEFRMAADEQEGRGISFGLSIFNTKDVSELHPRGNHHHRLRVRWQTEIQNHNQSKPISKSHKNPLYRRMEKDPKGILGPAEGGHIARLEFRKRFEKDADAREAFNKQVLEEKERRRLLRESRVVPDTMAGLVEYFLDSEAREIEVEIARLGPRLIKEFFDHLQLERSQLKFAVSRTKEMEDRVIELEVMQKVLLEGTEAYDRMEADLVVAKQRLTKILSSNDRKATMLEMVEHNELTRSVLSLLDENIAGALRSGQKEAANFMEDVRSTMLKYITA